MTSNRTKGTGYVETNVLDGLDRNSGFHGVSRRSKRISPPIQNSQIRQSDVLCRQSESINKQEAIKELNLFLLKAKDRKSDDWPLQIGKFLAGQVSEAASLKAAASMHAVTDAERKCEAYFYAGEKRLLGLAKVDKEKAVEYFLKCLDTNCKDFFEYSSASAELKALRKRK